MAINMSNVTESERIAAIAIGIYGADIRKQQEELSKATLPALIGAKLHVSPVDLYAVTILDCYIKQAKRGNK